MQKHKPKKFHPVRYVAKYHNGAWKAWDNKTKVWISKECPSKEIAEEIASDFCRMDAGDMRPVGLPDLSKLKERPN